MFDASILWIYFQPFPLKATLGSWRSWWTHFGSSYLVIKKHAERSSTSSPSYANYAKQRLALMKYHDGPEPPNFQGSQYCELILDGMHFSVKLSDTHVQLKYRNIVFTRNFLEETGEHSICSQFFKELANLYASGVSSAKLGIFRAASLSGEYSLWCVKNIKCECVSLPHEQSFYVIFCLTRM